MEAEVLPRGGHLGDLIEDEDAVQPLDAAIQSDLRDAVSRVLESLTPREERILRMRFGIGTKTDHTLQEVGQVFSVIAMPSRLIDMGVAIYESSPGSPTK